LESGAIRFGLGAVKNTGEAAIAAIIAAREAGGPFSDLHDFAERVEARALNRRLVESLVLAGAFDGWGVERGRLFAAVPLALDWGQRRRAEASRGQASLFGGGLLDARGALDAGGGGGAGGGGSAAARPALPDAPALTPLERAAREKEVLGFYLSGHPLDT